MSTTLTAEETPLYKIFSDEFIFSIPNVQRPYSWTDSEAGELLDDLLEFIDQHNINERTFSKIEDPYFLGSIVLVKSDKPDAQVLDGQQRLVTLTILLAVLRDYLSDDFASEIEDMIVQKGKQMLGTKDTYRVQLRNKDNDFFQNQIQIRGKTQRLSTNTRVQTDSQRLIRDNALYYIDRLNNLDESVVKILPNVIAKLCYIVVVSTQSFDSAFRIFTVLNDRGLDLMSSDIIKATAIDNIPEDEQNDYTQKWEDVEAALGRNRFNKLLEHIRMIIQQRKGGANLKDEYEEIFTQMGGKTFIDDKLIPYSNIYERLVDYQAYYHNNPEMIELLSLMNRIDNVDWITVAMYYMYYHEDRLAEFLYRLESFAAVGMILGKNYNWRMSKYSQILKEMELDSDVFSKLSTLEPANGDKRRVLEELNSDVYANLKDKAKRYVLLRLDALLTTGQPFYNHSIITVEHVLPQNPKEGSEWLKNFDDPEEYVHKLGNLVLLTRRKNSKAKNYDFQKKKASYFQSSSGITSFALTSQVMQEVEWTPAVICKRQEQLIQLLTDAWGLERHVSDHTDEKFYLETAKGISASGYPVDKAFLVEEGSIFSSVINESISSGNAEFRKELIDKGSLKKQGNYYVSQENITFSSPSTASSLLIGRSSNGLTSWKLANGETLKEVRNK